MEVRQVLQNIEKGHFKSVYFFFGEETYPVDHLVKIIREKAVDPSTADFNFDLLQAENTDGEAIVNMCSSFPMMAERRVVIVKSVQKLSTSDKNKLADYVQSPLDSTLLVLTAGKVDQRQKFYSTLKKNSEWIESKPLYENQAIPWIKQKFAQKKFRIDDKGAALLVQQIGTSQWHLHHEIEKILTYGIDKQIFNHEDVAKVVGFSRHYNSWELVDAIGRKEFPWAMEILNHMIDEGISAVGMIIQFTQRIILLLKIKASMNRGLAQEEIARTFGLRPFFAKMYVQQARKFQYDELSSGLRWLLLMDASLKSGRIKPELALILTVHQLIKGKIPKKLYHQWNF